MSKAQTPKLTSLDDHNQERHNEFLISVQPYLNGIACPKCGDELYDSNPNVALTSYPPKYNIHCSSCGYIGYRY